MILPLLAACVSQPSPAAIASPSDVVLASDPAWSFEESDIPVDPGYRFGLLPNGMRYVIRSNDTPDETAIVRMEVQTGSLDENESELGFAHFVEHMAFNGSTNVPEGEMIRLLEREGLAFGADTNASTGFEHTQYMLDLPRNDHALLDLALMLMRETVSELTFSPAAVAREKGVVLAEMRDRNSFAQRNAVDNMHFRNPGALYPQRFPIGTTKSLNAASSEGL
ncbi:MAG: insulinase family protein, partial [Sphingomonadaceae bacterium]|nr:insulinase family protein [Sphingomonadaceae bacterium]